MNIEVVANDVAVPSGVVAVPASAISSGPGTGLAPDHSDTWPVRRSIVPATSGGETEGIHKYSFMPPGLLRLKKGFFGAWNANLGPLGSRSIVSNGIPGILNDSR